MTKQEIINEIIKSANVINSTSTRTMEVVFYRMMKARKEWLENALDCINKGKAEPKFVIHVASSIILK